MRKGLSLAEVVVAVSLVSLVMIFLFTMLPTTAVATRRAEHRQAASFLAEELLSRTQALAFAEVLDGTYDPGNPGFYGADLSARQLQDGLLLEPVVEVRDVTGVSRDRLYQVRVTIRWKERDQELSLVRELRMSAMTR